MNSRILTILVVVLHLAILSACGGGNTTKITATVNQPADTGANVVIVAKSQLKIINGTPVEWLASPQFVQVFAVSPDGTISRCSGTVIGPSHVITAGHCFARGVASAYIETINGMFPALGIALHPGYREDVENQAIFNDAAIIVTDPHGVPGLPIVLSRVPTSEETISLFGFGLDENGESGTLRAGTSKIDFITPNHLFSAPFDGSTSNSCFGDSGGPAVYSFDKEGIVVAGIIGLVSSGSDEACGEGDVTLYTNLQNPEILAFIFAILPDTPII